MCSKLDYNVPKNDIAPHSDRPMCCFRLDIGIYQHCVSRNSDTIGETLKDWCPFTSQVKNVYVDPDVLSRSHTIFDWELRQMTINSRYITIYNHEAITVENRPDLERTTNILSGSTFGVKLSH